MDFIRKGLEVHEIGSVEPGNVGGFEFEILVDTLISEIFYFFVNLTFPSGSFAVIDTNLIYFLTSANKSKFQFAAVALLVLDGVVFLTSSSIT